MVIRLLTPGLIRIIPQDILTISEAVKMGEIDAREAYTELILDAEILVDDPELKKIAALPEVAKELLQVVAPETPQYKPQDWRAKMPVMREIQWKKQPIIQYIAQTYKNDVIQAARDQFKTMPNDWVATLFDQVTYRLEPKALQLSPTEDKKWKSVYIQLVMDLGTAENYKGFIGKFAKEFEEAVESGKITDDKKIIFQSSLKGLESTLKSLDPYAGAKLSSTMVQNWEVADEPGYDKEIRSGFYDRLTEVAELASGRRLRLDNISDDGKFEFSVLEEHSETPEDIAADMEEED